MPPDRPQRELNSRRLGLWCLGARGSISTCLVHGLSGMREGMLEPVGLATERDPFTRLPLVGLDELVLGGHDVCQRDFGTGADARKPDTADHTRDLVGRRSRARRIIIA